MKRRSAFLDSQRVIGGGFTAHERELRRALRRLMVAAYDARREYSEDPAIANRVNHAIDEAWSILEPKRK